MSWRSAWSVALGYTLLISGCLGEIGAPINPPPPPRPPPPPGTPPPFVPPPLVCAPELDVGRTPIHRLTRLEYDRTIADLTGDASRPASTFPDDPSHNGFDNVSDVQTVSLLHAEKYEAAATAISRGIWEREFDPGLFKRWEAETRSEVPAYEMIQQACCGSNMWNNVIANGARGFWTAYRIFVLTELDRPAPYTVTVSAWTESATIASRPLELQVLYNSQPVASVVLTATREAPELVRATVQVETAGYHRFDIQLHDPTRYSDPPPPPKVWVDWFTIERASTRTAEPPLVRGCELVEPGCLRETLAHFTRRAFRRPAESEELDRLLELHQAARAAGDAEPEAFTQVLEAILLSPHFLYRVELDPDLDSTAAHPLSAHELAARLSYFLTATMPDEVLAAKADDQTILDPGVLLAEAERLLASSESDVMVQNLAEQWMSTRALEVISPSPELFPNFTPELRESMGKESEMFFTAVFREDRPARELVDARFTFLDDRLAQHYGLPAPGSQTPVRVTVDSDQRGGVLGLGSVLALNSTPARPSEVLRGKWVLSQLLCDAPEPPPFNVPPLSSSPGMTAREQLEAHARNPICASCHAKMDPIGFALDGYDADGGFRTQDRQGNPLDVSGRFPDGTVVRGLSELRSYVASSPELEPCLTQHLLVYGLARSPSDDDRCHARELAARAESGASFATLLFEVVKSAPFAQRRAEGVRP